MDPLFGSRTNLLGLPAEFLLFAVAAVVWLVGFLWLRRIVSPPSDPHSFRATGHREATTTATLVAMAGAAGLALVAVALVLIVGGIGAS